MRKARLRAFRLLNDPLGDIRALTSSLLLVFVRFANLSVSWLFCVVLCFIRWIIVLLALIYSRCFLLYDYSEIIWNCSRPHDFLNISRYSA